MNLYVSDEWVQRYLLWQRSEDYLKTVTRITCGTLGFKHKKKHSSLTDQVIMAIDHLSNLGDLKNQM